MSTGHWSISCVVVIMDVDIMNNEPVMWTTLRGKEGLFPLYTHPPDDTALLRQALEALVFVDGDYETIKALRKRLEGKT